ncbi:Protein SUE-1 [Aphelenchoides avenae]|nr:Protein SUE-1 [Aphelenchus avenae]
MHPGSVLPPTGYNSGGSPHFLEPTCRRRQLPPTPTSPNAMQVAATLSPIHRRTSSPRLLPTPPPSSTPQSPPAQFAGTSAGPSPAQVILERRPSSGRRLPPVPVEQQSSFEQPSQLGPPLHLQRSASYEESGLEQDSQEQNNTLPKPTIASYAASAPQSPRELNASENAITGSPLSARRKFSEVRDPLSRNGSMVTGSMAHLLENQHLFRREFTATPDSLAHTQSNTSSLSPSIEQLNCVSSQSRKSSSSEGDDPSVHGLDPSLYIPGAVPCTSSSSVPDIVGSNGSAVTTNAGTHGTSVTTSVSNNSWPDNEPRPKGLGLIHCTLQHFPVRKRLRVSVLKIEGLAGELRPELEMQPFCKVNLVPGKSSKQQVSAVKRGRDATFNQEFFFDPVTSEDLDAKSLHIEVCHQSTQKLQKDLVIGEIRVPLKDLTQLHSKKEVRIVEELKSFINSKKLGKLHITSCIEKEARRLTINIKKADDLPKWGIIGAPDVCIRITMQQGSSQPQTKSSRVLKSTCTAVYNEAVMFLISTKQNDLQHTKITISVHDVSRSVTGDDVIGSAYLGELAVDKSEIDQWKNTVEHQGKEYKGCHNLKNPKNNAPDVHVSETHSDTEEGD